MVEVRLAREEDLAELFRIQLRALGFGHLLERYGPDDVPPLIRHGFERGETLVAEVDAFLAGFSVGYLRDGCWFLGEFFVNPGRQLGGIGQRLLARAVPSGVPIATVSTGDLRAHALYTRFGMTPRWPSYALEADAGSVSLPACAARAIGVEAGDATWRAWDQKICGRDRRPELAFHAGSWNALHFLIERAGRLIGYGGYARRAPGRVALGPVGALRAEDAVDCFSAIVQRALREPDVAVITADVPGPHPALPALLGGGFKIDELNVFCASDPARFGDPRRYAPMTAALY